jgi:Fe-S cluster assembly ATP-binding protein
MINLLAIENLTVTINNKTILQKINLNIEENQTHILMGPNGSGKSTLSKILAGHPLYQVEEGKIFLEHQNIILLPSEVRSHLGIFLAFQYPLEISGVTTFDFLKMIFNEKQKYLKQAELNPIEFFHYLLPFVDQLKIKKELLNRNFNEDFSGGEKKRVEILQLLLLKPKLIILDELDSGLDIDAIKLIYKTILLFKEKNSSILLITHYPEILNHITPDYVHILIDGKITKTGSQELIQKISTNGYINDFLLLE